MILEKIFKRYRNIFLQVWIRQEYDRVDDFIPASRLSSVKDYDFLCVASLSLSCSRSRPPRSRCMNSAIRRRANATHQRPWALGNERKGRLGPRRSKFPFISGTSIPGGTVNVVRKISLELWPQALSPPYRGGGLSRIDRGSDPGIELDQI